MSKLRRFKENYIDKEMRELSENNVLEFPKLITGGKDGGSGFWLLDMEVGSIFLARPNGDKHNWICGQYALYEKYEKCALLLFDNKDGTIPIHVDMRRFSNLNEHVETIKIVPREQLGVPVTNEPKE